MPQLTVQSPLGDLLLTEQDEILTGVAWRDETGADGTPLLRETARQLAAYFAGRLRDFDLPMQLAGSPFQRSVWQAMLRIPYGATRSYGDLAAELRSAAPAAATRSRSSCRATASLPPRVRSAATAAAAAPAAALPAGARRLRAARCRDAAAARANFRLTKLWRETP